jgi:alginate O-acetyltransferase complex protein AlgI
MARRQLIVRDLGIVAWNRGRVRALFPQRDGAGRHQKNWPRWLNFIGLLITFHFVTLLWVFFRAPTLEKARGMLATAFAGSGWNTAGDVVKAQTAAVLLLVVFFALHAFDDHRMIKLAIRRIRPEIVLPLIVLLWALAMTLSQGSSAKFIYFDF